MKNKVIVIDDDSFEEFKETFATFKKRLVEEEPTREIYHINLFLKKLVEDPKLIDSFDAD